MSIVSSESTAKAVVVDRNGNKLMSQTRKTSIKARKLEERHSDNEYLAKLGTIIRFLMRNAALGKVEMVRAFEYQIKSDGDNGRGRQQGDEGHSFDNWRPPLLARC